MFDPGAYAVLNRLQSAIQCYANAVLMPLYAMLCHAMPCYAIQRYAFLGCSFFLVDDAIIVVVVVPVAIAVGGVVVCFLCIWCCLVLSGAVWCRLVLSGVSSTSSISRSNKQRGRRTGAAS